MSKQPGRPWLYITLVVGGFLFVACCSCGGVGGWLGYKLTVPPNIVGRWENEFGGEIYEFRDDGTGQFETKGFGVYPFKYHFINYSDLVLTFPPPPKDAELRMEELRYQVAYFYDKMQWEDLNNRGFYTHLRRVN